MKPLRPIAHDELRGQPGPSRAAIEALVGQQPATVLEALRMHGSGARRPSGSSPGEFSLIPRVCRTGRGPWKSSGAKPD